MTNHHFREQVEKYRVELKRHLATYLWPQVTFDPVLRLLGFRDGAWQEPVTGVATPEICDQPTHVVESPDAEC